VALPGRVLGGWEKVGDMFSTVWVVLEGWGRRGTSPLSLGRLMLSLRYPRVSQSVVVSGIIHLQLFKESYQGRSSTLVALPGRVTALVRIGRRRSSNEVLSRLISTTTLFGKMEDRGLFEDDFRVSKAQIIRR
jgi:hypothetical protein